MCKLQFNSAPAQADGQDELDAYAYAQAEDGALAALLALAQKEMDFDLTDPLPSVVQQGQQRVGAEYVSPQHQGQRQGEHSKESKQDSSRYHCPFPNCKRSFCELWRLKVHYRAPPNIRGSGKERGHGMRLTHCPKCGAALKVGGHHVKCAAVPKGHAAGGSTGGRRNRKAAAAPRADAADAAMAAAAAYTEASYQQSQTAPMVGTAAAAGGNSRRSAYMQYGLSDMLQQETGNGQSMWHKALQLHAQQQQQQQTDEYSDEQHTPYQPMLGGSSTAKASAASLQRFASSDDSSSSRMVEASCSGGSGSGNDTNWAPSSSSGYGSGSDDMDGQQQQQPLLALFGSQPPAAVAAAAAAAAELAAPVEQEMLAVPEQEQQQPEQHAEAGQLLWQHMLLQHLQQHVQQTPGFSLPELIQVASALFGDRVDTLVSAFGLSGPNAVQCQEQAQLSQLVAALRQTDTDVPAAAPAAAAAAGYAAFASVFGAGMQ